MFCDLCVPHLFLHEVQHPARGGHHQVNLLIDPHNVVLQIGSTYNQRF